MTQLMQIFTMVVSLTAVHGLDGSDGGSLDVATCPSNGCSTQGSLAKLPDVTSLIQGNMRLHGKTQATPSEQEEPTPTQEPKPLIVAPQKEPTPMPKPLIVAPQREPTPTQEPKPSIVAPQKTPTSIVGEEPKPSTEETTSGEPQVTIVSDVDNDGDADIGFEAILKGVDNGIIKDVITSGCVGFRGADGKCHDTGVADPPREPFDVPSTSAETTPTKLFSSEPENPFALPPLRKTKKLYTWSRHLNEPIHLRIERERTGNGKIVYMRGIRLDKIHERVVLMDTTRKLLDVHDVMANPQSLKEWQFPVLIEFNDREDPVKPNGDVDWVNLFKEQIVAADAALVTATSELEEAKHKWKTDLKIKRDAIQMDKDLEAVMKKDVAMFTGEEKSLKQLKDLRVNKLSVKKGAWNSQFWKKMQKLNQAAMEQDVKALEIRRERAVQASQSLHNKYQFQLKKDKVKKAKANAKWLRRLEGLMVPRLEKDSKLAIIMKKVFTEEDGEEDEMLGSHVSAADGIEAITSKEVMEQFISNKIASKLGVPLKIVLYNAMVVIRLWLEGIKEILVELAVVPIAAVPFVGGFLAITCHWLLNAAFEYIAAIIERVMDMLADVVKDAMCKGIAKVIIAAIGDNFGTKAKVQKTLTLDQAALKTSMDKCKNDAVDASSKQMEDGLKTVKADPEAENDILNIAEDLGAEADKESQEDLRLWGTHFEGDQEDSSCALQAPLNNCEHVVVDDEEECAQYYDKSDNGEVAQCKGKGLFARKGCRPGGPTCYAKEGVCQDSQEELPSAPDAHYRCKDLLKYCGKSLTIDANGIKGPLISINALCPKSCNACPSKDQKGGSLEGDTYGCFSIIGGGNRERSEYKNGDYGSTYPHCKCTAHPGGSGDRKFDFHLFAGNEMIHDERQFNMRDPKIAKYIKEGTQLRCKGVFSTWPAGNDLAA